MGLLSIQGSDGTPRRVGDALGAGEPGCAVAVGPQLAGCLEQVGDREGYQGRPD